MQRVIQLSVSQNGRNKILFRACLPRMDPHKLILFLEFFKNHLSSCVINRKSYMCSYCSTSTYYVGTLEVSEKRVH